LDDFRQQILVGDKKAGSTVATFSANAG